MRQNLHPRSLALSPYSRHRGVRSVGTSYPHVSFVDDNFSRSESHAMSRSNRQYAKAQVVLHVSTDEHVSPLQPQMRSPLAHNVQLNLGQHGVAFTKLMFILRAAEIFQQSPKRVWAALVLQLDDG